MNCLKWIWEWSKRNLSNMFSILGILLTIYFGVYYVPGYLQEMREEKVNTINEGLIENIQELLYNNQRLTVEEIDSLIKAKEIKYTISYPYTKDELLIQISGRFLENKFIPLEQRKSLIEKIENLRKEIKEPQPKPEEKSSTVVSSILEKLISILSLGLALLGLISTAQKAKRDRHEQIKEDLEERETELQNSIMNAFSFELTVREALNGKSFVHHSHGHDTGYDFTVNENNREYVIQCKYYQKAINVTEIRGLINILTNLNAALILVTNAQLTNTARNFIKEYTNSNSRQLFVVQGTNREEISRQLNSIFESNS
ncbi:restriction endonuclease [Paenibacillus chitinolyticus]|uniref:restriction endonuclease n=1 Tax=Paenibacillus chitinolyticus TaxID=79263 RepID=UPI001C44FC53|nr:restriction endonuclease [Paenibacillus chitinolyticus]MBV6717339.1 restriction endonuclease [Paenibacillus chitinolyticus]